MRPDQFTYTHPAHFDFKRQIGFAQYSLAGKSFRISLIIAGNYVNNFLLRELAKLTNRLHCNSQCEA